jgi:hypothetical protein
LLYLVTAETTVPETFYQACGNNNILRTANNGHAFQNIQTLTTQFTVTRIPDIVRQYDCCVACMLRPDCLFSYRILGRTDCYIYPTVSPAAAVCPNGQVKWANYYTNAAATVIYEVSNGPCGTMGNIGDQ